MRGIIIKFFCCWERDVQFYRYYWYDLLFPWQVGRPTRAKTYVHRMYQFFLCWFCVNNVLHRRVFPSRAIYADQQTFLGYKYGKKYNNKKTRNLHFVRVFQFWECLYKCLQKKYSIEIFISFLLKNSRFLLNSGIS